ncbi:MAG: hypothetical protein HY422_02485 [Candidatus Komeilibacteria bacterium]|nr:hypothetical protein [Candidatus Komeilibacteria bacterium]
MVKRFTVEPASFTLAIVPLKYQLCYAFMVNTYSIEVGTPATVGKTGQVLN